MKLNINKLTIIIKRGTRNKKIAFTFVALASKTMAFWDTIYY